MRSDDLLVRERDLGAHDDPGPRPLPEPGRLIRWGRPVLRPLSSAMRVDTTDRVIGLTYDDGPHPEHTGEILDALAARGVQATFFVLATSAQRYPETIRRILAEGHAVARHGLDHAKLTEVSPLAAARAVRTGHRVLRRVAGRRITMYRPTYGAQGLAQFLTARLLGMDVVYWTAWARDWIDAPVADLANLALNARHPGAVLLLHDLTEDTMEDEVGPRPTFSRGALTAAVLDGLASDGYRAVPVGRLFADYPVVRAVTTRRPWAGLRARAAGLTGRVAHRRPHQHPQGSPSTSRTTAAPD